MNKKHLFSFLCLLGLDQGTKFFAQQYVPKISLYDRVYPFGGIGVFENFFGISCSLNSTLNTGGAWGLFATFPRAFFVFRLIAFTFLVGYFFFGKKFRCFFSVSLILAGALGNILDTFFYQGVVDFIHLVFWGYSFPIFNLADLFICVGTLLFLCCSKKLA